MLQGKCTNGSLTLVLICATNVRNQEFTTPSVQDTLDNLSRIVNELRMNAKESATEKQTDIDNEADCGVALVASKSSNKFQRHRAKITSF